MQTGWQLLLVLLSVWQKMVKNELQIRMQTLAPVAQAMSLINQVFINKGIHCISFGPYVTNGSVTYFGMQIKRIAWFKMCVLSEEKINAVVDVWLALPPDLLKLSPGFQS